MKMTTALSYDDVLLVPQYSDIVSRKEVSLASPLDNWRELELPIISSPMDTITESSMANAMAEQGGLGIIHRYNSIEMQAQQAYQVRDHDRKAAAIGITGDYLERAQALYDVGVRILCLDVAHGHHILMKNAIEKLKSLYSDVHIMAGNVATKAGFGVQILSDAILDLDLFAQPVFKRVMVCRVFKPSLNALQQILHEMLKLLLMVV
jgi:IMP dehydrogenase